MESKRKPRQPSINAIAHHEAGHAVAAIVLQLPFRYVTIEPEGDSLGHLLHNKFHDSFRPDESAKGIYMPWRVRDKLERHAICSFAGPAAERQLTGRNNHIGASGDRENAINMLSYAADDGELDTYLKLMKLRAEALIHTCWINVHTIAELLKCNTRLSSKECRQVMRSSLGVRING